VINGYLLALAALFLEDDVGHGCRGRSSEREAVELTIAERREEAQKLAAEGSIARESKRDKPE